MLIFVDISMTTYFYAGDNGVASSAAEIDRDGNAYFVMYFDVAIYYSDYIGADTVPSAEPKNLPGLSNVSFNAYIYRSISGTPTNKYAVAKLINQQDIQDISDPRKILGTRYTFCSKIVEDCNGDFTMVWSTNRIEMPYGGDMIFIEAQNGSTPEITVCAG